MSIIYDALNKVEKNNPHPSEKVTKNSKPQNVKLYFLYGLILVLGFIGAQALVSFVFVKPVKKAEVVAKPASVVVKKENIPAPVVQNSAALAVTQTEAVPANQPVSQEIAPAVKEVKNIEPPPLVLNGVFISPDEKYAIVNNQIVGEGDKVDGATVLSILENKVEVDFEGLKISLTSSGK